MDPHTRCLKALGFLLILSLWSVSHTIAGEVDVGTSDDLRIEIMRKGSGKQAVISQGAKEWFLLIDVTTENTVVVRQEKDHDRYVIDQSETHDHPMTPGEVDAAIAEYVESVRTRVRK